MAQAAGMESAHRAATAVAHAGETGEIVLAFQKLGGGGNGGQIQFLPAMQLRSAEKRVAVGLIPDDIFGTAS